MADATFALFFVPFADSNRVPPTSVTLGLTDVSPQPPLEPIRFYLVIRQVKHRVS